MMDPFPQVFSICVMASVSALRRSSVSFVGAGCCSAMSDLDIGGEPPFVRPEYIPKPLSSPSGTECVLQMLQLIGNNSDTIEAIHVATLAKSVHPDPRRLHDLAALGAGDRFEWAAERRVATSFDFEEGDQVAAACDEVQLDPADAKPVRDDLPPTALQKAHRLFLAGEPTLVPRVSPVRWIAVHPARHGAKVREALRGE